VCSAAGAERVVAVSNDASLRAALHKAEPGTIIRIAPGQYQPGIYVAQLKRSRQQPIVIEGVDEARRPCFEGGKAAWHLSDCAYVVFRNIAVRGQSGNGINIDDGGTHESPTHDIVLDNIRVSDIGPKGNLDGIKLSGVNDFVVRRCRVEGWGGQAIDMVGCHRGLIEDCEFVGKEGFSQAHGPQTKGGSSQITIRRCWFHDAGSRAVNIGGSTGRAYFRPPGAQYEAKEIVVEGCTFVGSMAPIAYVGVDGAVVRYNTLYYPETWVVRILQETRDPGFAPCGNGRFERNLVVFRRSDIRTFVNVGPGTAPETFRFSDNFWYCQDRPEASKPQLPVLEENGVYGRDPRLDATGSKHLKPRDPVAARYGASAWKPERAATRRR
jgi:hypothetical protein